MPLGPQEAFSRQLIQRTTLHRLRYELSKPVRVRECKNVICNYPNHKTKQRNKKEVIKLKIIILGLPGAGKGTQAKFISNKFAVPHISTGDLFRRAEQEQTDLGLLAREYMKKGELVPDEITVKIALNRLEELDLNKGFLLDGFPRNLDQAIALNDYLDSKSTEIDVVIYIELNEDLLIKRLTGRRVCIECGSAYHLINKPA
jgi:adenylate kinase